MAEPHCQAPALANQHGFTLVEMLAAMAILLVAVTTLLASLGDSVALRRSTDARLQVAQAIDDIVVRVRETGIKRAANAESDLDLQLTVPETIEMPLFPGLVCRVTKTEAADRLDIWLLRIEATWLDEGEAMSEVFFRVVPRQLPLGVRIQRFREVNPR
ncbi:hypothetical protein LBMAG49_10060 [Planctomycetota bacterium]|jgi:prepilin-type N-terminal cleavage/methylation domain-containing protein|nr:type II secretion system protein [Planctomycetota bacterium]GDY01677.1 hypothetical protein LBMAG49_10060 [Planctomycetota bacterium]